MKRVLVLRPEPGGSETVRRAEAKGLAAEARPLFAVEPIEWEAPEAGSFDGLLLTSANALRHGGDQLQDLRGLPAYAVGEATAEAAREAGFDIKSVGDAGVDRLLGSIEPEMKLLHLCGEDRRPPDGARQEIVSLPVYRAVETGASPPEGVDALLVHSPRAARAIAERWIDRPASPRIACAISPAAAEPLEGLDLKEIRVAASPDETALLACLGKPPGAV